MWWKNLFFPLLSSGSTHQAQDGKSQSQTNALWILIGSKISFKRWLFETCLVVKKWVIPSCFKNRKASLRNFWVHDRRCILTSDGAAWSWRFSLNDFNIAFRKSDSGSNPNKDIYVFPVKSYRLFGAPKMEPHAWMTLLMIYLYG